MDKLFKVYKSSAGSGKTFTLVKEYLKLCLLAESPFHFTSILAITFTNKATYEMKSRIITALQSLSVDSAESDFDPLLRSLIAETGLEKEDLQKKCEQILRSIIHTYGDFSISTIDRFSHRLIRTFAKDLALPMNFKVEVDEQRILDETISRLIGEVGINPDVSKWLLSFVFYKQEEDKSWRVEDDLLDFAKSLLSEQNQFYLEAIRKLDVKVFEETKITYLKQNHEFEKRLKELAQRAMILIEQKGIDLASFFRGKSGIGGYFLKIAKGEKDKLEPNTYVRATIEEDNWISKKCSAEEAASSIESVKAELTLRYLDIQKLIETEFSNYLARKEVLKNIYHLALIREIESRISEFKKTEKLVHISDFNKKIAEVVLKEPMPFIYERLGERYHHIMVDEFQDTSTLQFINILPLIEESLGRAKMNMIVGDAKQAIYRFRGGEMRQLADMPHYRPEFIDQDEIVNFRMSTLESQFSEERLDTNHRSYGSIVKFNNAFFSFVAELGEVSDNAAKVFENYNQEVKNKPNDGFVDIRVIEGDDQREQQLNLVKSNIEQVIGEGYLYSEIAVLCRTNQDASLVADFLSFHQLPLISAEALLLKNSPRIKFIIAIARWLFNHEDTKAEKEVLEYISNVKGISVESLFYQRFVKAEPLLEILEKNNYVVDPDFLKAKSSHSFFESLIRLFQLDKTYDPYVQFWQEEVFSYTHNFGNSVVEFLEYWDQKKDKLALNIPEGINAVQILTVHKSKGLEFPVVIMPFANQKVKHRNDLLWARSLKSSRERLPYVLVNFNQTLSRSSFSEVYQKELEKKESDLLHDNYVAFTRAVDRLYIQTERAPKSESLLSLPMLIDKFINSGFLEQDASDESHFTFGNRREKEQKNKEISSEQELVYYSFDWKDKVSLSLESDLQWEINQTNERDYGNLIHDILAQLEDSTQLENTLSRFHLNGKVNSDERETLEIKLNKLLDHKEIAPLFAEGVKNRREASLIDSEGRMMRPDRVIFFAEKVVVLDYKTGEEREADIAQLRNYMEVIAKTIDLRVEGFILYTKDIKVIRVN